MIARYVLPWFGGGPAVWTNCMLFFQLMLLAGYAYAHWLGSARNRKLQSGIHIALLAVSLLFLPVVPRAALWKPASSGDPSGRILLLLAATVGVPYLLLSSTTPLLQRWFHLARDGQSPWRLYALSNFGSLLALLSYPFVFEPFLRLRTQTLLWSALYAVFVVCCGWTTWRVVAVRPAAPPLETESDSGLPLRDVLLWLALSACSSILLLATTNQISQEIAVSPFLWIAPLSIYLLTFILTFESDFWYRRGLFAAAAGVLAPVTCAVVGATVVVSLWTQLGVDLAALFVTCMVCHGELARSRPSPRHLTGFYLTISAGGAMGGVFAALIAPRIFTEFSEYPAALAAACLLGFLGWLRSGVLAQWTSRNFAVRLPLMALLFGGVTSIVAGVTSVQTGLENRRTFYGILRVSQRTDPQNGRLRQLTHGRIQHGFEYLDGARRDRPTSYYGPSSGVGVALDALPGPRRVAVIGLGAGTLAAWGRPGDTFRFYEINPAVEAIARNWFFFLKDSAARTEVVLGDARVQLERELAAGRSHDFDLIAVDAFSSDAIPIHLLTAECGDLYRQRLAPDGILALHISNRSLDLEPVARGLAQHLGWNARMVIGLFNSNTGESNSRWVLLAEKAGTLDQYRIHETLVGLSGTRRSNLAWTDDFASLWHVLRL